MCPVRVVSWTAQQLDMGRYFDILLAQPLADGFTEDILSAQRLSDELQSSVGVESLAERIRAHLPTLQQLSAPLVVRIAHALSRPHTGEPPWSLWADLRARYPHNNALSSVYAGVLLDAGRRDEGIALLVETLESYSPTSSLECALVLEMSGSHTTRLGEQAYHAGDRAWLGYQLVALRAQIANAEQLDMYDLTDIDTPGPEVREQYSELLERYAADPEAMAELRELGREIADLETRGLLPRVMSRRGSWRSE